MVLSFLTRCSIQALIIRFFSNEFEKTNKVDDTIDCSGYRYQDSINCPGIQWEYCTESGDENFDTSCDEETSEIEISRQAFISFDGDLLNDFNQLTDNDLETSLGKIKTSNSLNEYMTKIDFCYSENDELIYTNDTVASEILLRLVYEIARVFFHDRFEMLVTILTYIDSSWNSTS